MVEKLQPVELRDVIVGGDGEEDGGDKMNVKLQYAKELIVGGARRGDLKVR